MILYLLFRFLTYPLSWLPQPVLYFLGLGAGNLCFFLVPRLKNKAMKHLSLATTLGLPTEKIPNIARKSLQNLMITCLEFIKFSTRGNPSRYIDLIDDSGGKWNKVIFACAHEANWELFFWQGSLLMPLVGIAKPFKNPYFDRFVQRARERFGGKLYPPKNGIKECLRALKHEKVVGLIIDHSKPDLGIKSTFFGREVYANTIHALLSYKTGAPIIPATLSRRGTRYQMHFHAPLYPNLERPLQEEVERLVQATNTVFENSITSQPEKWLWIYNRYRMS